MPAVARAARLLDVVADAREPLTLAELTAKLGAAKSTVHNLCSTLVASGLMTRYDNGTYHLGLRVMDLAHAFLARTDLTVEFARLWDAMALLPEETIILSVLDGADVVYIACRNGSRPLGVNFRIGMRLPATCTASGKAILSTIAPARLAELMRGSGFRTLTRRSVRDAATLARQLEQIRARGYSIDDEETRDGMICFGAPIFDSGSSEAVAGAAVSMLKAAISRQRTAVAVTAVTRLAAQLSKRLGARELVLPVPPRRPRRG
ncbi:MAG TPA: IclR family transcriptional regulator [Casimicrobiaceae bacterium]